MQITDSVKAVGERRRRSRERGGGCDMIYNEIINLEKQNGLCDINSISQTDTLQEQYLVHTHNTLVTAQEKHAVAHRHTQTHK